VRQTHNYDGDGSSIFPSALHPLSPSQFRTPTRKNRKRKRTPLSRPGLQSEGEMDNADLFAYGVVDDLDDREESVALENAGSDKENHRDPQEILESDDIAINTHLCLLQANAVSFSLVMRRSHLPAAMILTHLAFWLPRDFSSMCFPGPRLPFGELTAAEVVPPAMTSQPIPLPLSPSQSQSRPASPYRRYSDSEIEDLYAPASLPHTPRSRLTHAWGGLFVDGIRRLVATLCLSIHRPNCRRCAPSEQLR
jgi:hypothetical protein